MSYYQRRTCCWWPWLRWSFCRFPGLQSAGGFAGGHQAETVLKGSRPPSGSPSQSLGPYSPLASAWSQFIKDEWLFLSLKLFFSSSQRRGRRRNCLTFWQLFWWGGISGESGHSKPLVVSSAAGQCHGLDFPSSCTWGAQWFHQWPWSSQCYVQTWDIQKQQHMLLGELKDCSPPGVCNRRQETKYSFFILHAELLDSF